MDLSKLHDLPATTHTRRKELDGTKRLANSACDATVQVAENLNKTCSATLLGAITKMEFNLTVPVLIEWDPARIRQLGLAVHHLSFASKC